MIFEILTVMLLEIRVLDCYALSVCRVPDVSIDIWHCLRLYDPSKGRQLFTTRRSVTPRTTRILPTYQRFPTIIQNPASRNVVEKKEEMCLGEILKQNGAYMYCILQRLKTAFFTQNI
jgi:hypothetical protein